MKRVIATILLLSTATSSLAQEQCTNADPSSTLAGVTGNEMMEADPQDPAQNVIYSNNVASGASNIVVARMDGLSGLAVPGSLKIVANNFQGSSIIQGPSFVQTPKGEVGLLYSGPGGVHGVFRPPEPMAWYNFSFDVHGAPTNGSPPTLPSTSKGAVPLSFMPPGFSTYGQTLGQCTGTGGNGVDHCFGALGFGVYTNVNAVLSPQGYAVYEAVQSPTRDGYIFISACRASFCGLYEGLIDNAGGFVPNTVTMLAQTQQAPENIAAARHPVTGTTVLFSQNGTTLIDVWEQPAGGGALKLIGSVPSITASHHYDAIPSATEVVLRYYGPQRFGGGSFTIPVTASGGSLVVGVSKMISTFNNGSQFVWYPAANKWGFYYYSNGATLLTRCWVTP